QLDVTERRLWRDRTEPVQLPPEGFDLLVLLVENRGRLLDKGFLLESLWPGTFVEDANLSVNVSLLRKVLGEGAGETYIETVPKRGYRFVANVTQLTSSAEAVPATVEAPKPVPPETLEVRRRPNRRRWWIWGLAGCLIVATLVGWLVQKEIPR